SLMDDFSRGFPGNSDWRGPTTIANDGGVFYFGTLTPFPLIPGAAQVYRLNAGGHYTLFAGGLTAVVGVAFDSAGRLYALENTTCASPCFPTPFTGTVVRLNRDGTFATIASGLMFPTAMTFGPDGNLYVSTFGFGGPPGAGTIVKVTIAG
ncbi:MAG TPA: ScyD/ScyE family protein, partial [Candidatus Dormibacteraeota bacterium]|nr:ScyD/ScyE family protein [Candidatus Dormibacteraeota bacterium]